MTLNVTEKWWEQKQADVVAPKTEQRKVLPAGHLGVPTDRDLYHITVTPLVWVWPWSFIAWHPSVSLSPYVSRPSTLTNCQVKGRNAESGLPPNSIVTLFVKQEKTLQKKKRSPGKAPAAVCHYVVFRAHLSKCSSDIMTMFFFGSLWLQHILGYIASCVSGLRAFNQRPSFTQVISLVQV